MKKRHLKLIALLLAFSAFLLTAETIVRLLWSDKPPLVRPADDDIFIPSNNSRLEYEMKPNGNFYYRGAPVSLNNEGLRSPQPAIPKPAKNFRILMLGDELVFGPGLSPEASLPSQLQQNLLRHSVNRTIEVINAGVPGYGIDADIALLNRLAPLYQPDLVLLMISENSLDPSSAHKTSLPSETRPPEPEPRDKEFRNFGRRMLPDAPAPIRYSLANYSALYLYSALSMKGALSKTTFLPARSSDFDTPGFRDTDLFSFSFCQSDYRLWDGIKRNMEELKSLSAANKFVAAGIIYSDYRLRGRGAQKLMEILERAQIPAINLSVFRDSEIEEKQKHSLHWSPWPNSASASEDADRLASLLIQRNILSSGVALSQSSNKTYDELQSSRKSMYWEIIAGKDVEDRVSKQEFSSKIDFSDPTSFQKEQILYGWWPLEAFSWIGFPDTAWMAGEASVRLTKPDNAIALHIAGRTSPAPGAATSTISLSVFFDCLPGEKFDLPGGNRFDLYAPVPKGMNSLRWLEISIRAASTITPDSVGMKKGDKRKLSVGVDVIELK